MVEHREQESPKLNEDQSGNHGILVQYPLTKNKYRYYGMLKWLLLSGIFIIFYFAAMLSNGLATILVFISFILLGSTYFVTNTKIHRLFLENNWISEEEKENLSNLSLDLQNGYYPPIIRRDTNLFLKLIGGILIGIGFLFIIFGGIAEPETEISYFIALLILGYIPFAAGGILLNRNYDPDILGQYQYISNQVQKPQYVQQQSPGQHDPVYQPQGQQMQQPAQYVQQNQDQMEVSQNVFCGKCGTKNNTSDQFCRECGAQLESSQSTTKSQHQTQYPQQQPQQKTVVNTQGGYTQHQYQQPAYQQSPHYVSEQKLEEEGYGTKLARVGGGLVILQNVLLIYYLFSIDSNASDAEVLNTMELIWNLVFKMDMVAVLLMGIGLFILYNEKQQNNYLWSSITLIAWVIITFIWRIVLIGNPFLGITDVLTAIANFEDAVVYFVIAGFVFTVSGYFLWKAKIGGGLMFFVFTIGNLIGNLVLRSLLDIEQFATYQEFENRAMLGLSLKMLLIPILGIFAGIKIATTSSKPIK